MKKYLFILLLFFIFPTSVSAINNVTTEEFVSGITYRSGNNYEKISPWANTYVNNVFAYCVEPQVINNVNVELQQINEPKILSEEQWKRVTLIANYAEYYYMQTSSINFRYAGQILIHEYLDISLGNRAIFINNVLLDTSYEENLIMKKVLDYDQVIETNKINSNLVDEFVLENDLFLNYEVVSYDKSIANIKIDSNKLVINGLSEGNTTLVLRDKSKLITKGAFYWYGDSTQDLITSTATLDYKLKIDVNVEDMLGTLNVNKINSETKSRIEGAGFLIYKFDLAQNDYVKHFDEIYYTNKDGELNIDLMEGKYRLVEEVIPDGYVRELDYYDFTIKRKTITEIDVYNLEKTLLSAGKIQYSFLFTTLTVIFRVFRHFK